MKKKNNSSTSITKEYLENEFAKLAGKKDLEITEKSLRKDLEITEKSLRIDFKLALLNLERRIEQKITQTRDVLLTTFDPLLKELEDRREDREIATHQYSEIVEQVDDHEKRIKKIEVQKTI